MLGARVAISDGLSYITGRGISIGNALAMKDFVLVATFFMMVLVFVAGSFTGTRLQKQYGLWAGLLMTAFTMSIFAISTAFVGEESEEVLLGSRALIPFAMGCMNASTSVAGVGRTTHLSGPTTDIGINLANKDYEAAIYWVFRWLGFILGAYASALAVDSYAPNPTSNVTLFMVPTVIIAVEAVYIKIMRY